MGQINKLFILLLLSTLSINIMAVDRMARLGIGMTDQLKIDLPAISFKLQNNPSFAIGGFVGFSSDDNGGGHGAGLKVYRNFFEEPQLHFFGALMGALIKQKTSAAVEESGFQFDVTLGSEFSFTGLNSLGFSFEFGVSLNKLDEFVIETIGNHFIVSSIHFYL